MSAPARALPAARGPALAVVDEVSRRRPGVGRDWLLTLAIGAMALVLDLFNLSRTSLWGDEAFSVDLAGKPWPIFWNYILTSEPNMMLYHLVLRVWLGFVSLLGWPANELVVRLPTVLFAVLGVLAVFWLGRRFWGRTVGVIGAVLYLLNELQLVAAREARSYSLEMLLICLGWYAWFSALTAARHRRSWWAAYVVAMTLALYAHLFSALVLAAQVVAFLGLLLLRTEWREAARRSVADMVVSVSAIGVAFAPLAIHAALRGSTNPHVAPATLYGFARLLWNLAGHSVLYGVLLAGAAAGAVIVMRSGKGRVEASGIVALVCWLTVPVALSYVATQPRLNLHLFEWGYLVVVVPALCILAGIGITRIPLAPARRALAIALLVAAALTVPGYASSPAQDFMSASLWIESRYQPGDGLLCTSWSCSLAMDYYVQARGGPSQLIAGTPTTWSWTQRGAVPLEQQEIATYVTAHPRVFLVDSVISGDSASVKQQAMMAQDWLDRHGLLLSDAAIPSSLGPVRIRLYQIDQAAR